MLGILYWSLEQFSFEHKFLPQLELFHCTLPHLKLTVATGKLAWIPSLIFLFSCTNFGSSSTFFLSSTNIFSPPICFFSSFSFVSFLFSFFFFSSFSFSSSM